jgi:hypothetical protein
MRKTFPRRSFSPIAYNTKKLLNKYDYNLGNYNEIIILCFRKSQKHIAKSDYNF